MKNPTPWNFLDSETLIGTVAYSDLKKGETFEIARASHSIDKSGKRWTILFDADNVRHARTPSDIIESFTAFVDITTAHVAEEDGVDLDTARKHVLAIARGEHNGLRGSDRYTS